MELRSQNLTVCYVRFGKFQFHINCVLNTFFILLFDLMTAFWTETCSWK